MEKQKKLSRISSYCSYVYLLILCVGTGLIGSALIFFCRGSFPEFRDTVGLANSLCFLTGVVMSSFVISWVIYIAFLSSCQATLDSGSNCKQNKRAEASEEKNASLKIVSGQICFFLLLLTALAELTCLGFMWWTSFSLNDKFLVEEDCFCFKNHQGPVIENILLEDGLDVSCPVSRGEINCVSTYGELEVLLSSNNSRSNLHVTLKNCQRLDQYDKQDSDCLNFTDFWFLFKMLRIVLPILAVMKLPFLLMNCLEVLSANIDPNLCDDQEFQVAELRSPLSLMSPRARSKVSNSKVSSSPYFGLRLAPLGEEEVRQSSLINNGLNVPVKKGNIVGFLARQEPASPSPTMMAEEDIVNDTDSVFKSNSPHSSIQDCVISTPIQRGMKSPSFDLSKVIRPVFPSTGSEEFTYRQPPARAISSHTASIPSSTFKSTLPAVFRHQTDLEIDRSFDEDVFYTPAFSHHPYEHIPMARSIRLGSLPDPEVPPRHNVGKTKRFSLSRTKHPVKTGPDMDEIVKTANARSKSVTSKIDWTKMP